MLNILTVAVILALLSVDLYCNRKPVEEGDSGYDYR